eukprot:GHVR01065150.1.p1 GENE.GHVR01065150.1~~GHVR01065150.1.p1  ORF type:complete len:142 (+),score=19.53 GHVR01065150.1:1096-1521(+)
MGKASINMRIHGHLMGSFQTIKSAREDQSDIEMDKSMRVTLKMGKNMGMECILGQMDLSIKGHTAMMRNMGMENLKNVMAKYLREHGSMERDRAKARSGLMEKQFKENGRMTNQENYETTSLISKFYDTYSFYQRKESTFN